MNVSLDRMRYWVRKELTGVESQAIGDDEIDELLNFSLWNIESEFPFRTKERCVHVDTVIGQAEYDLSAIIRLDAITSIAVIDSEGRRRKLSRTSRDWIDSNANFEEDEGFPTKYLRENNKITLFPVPTGEWEMVLHFRQSVASLAEGQVETTGLPRNWDEIVISGAVWRGLKAQNRYEEMNIAMGVTGRLINMATPVEEKEERDSRFARVQVIHEFPDDPSSYPEY